MGKASSAKKIKKVQQAGVSRAPGQRRNLGYPALIVAILVVGVGLTFLARGERAASASEAPVVNRDHWHAAFGVNICGEWQPALHDDGPDTAGIHTHADGLIHIHPFVGAASGDRAVFSVFARQVGIQVSDGALELPDKSFADGDDCTDEDGETKPGRVALYVWPPQATEATEPTIITGDAINDERFRRDGQVFVLAFVPEDAEVGFPPSMSELANPSDLETPSEPGSVEFTVPGDGEGVEIPAEETPTEETPAAETPGEDAPADAPADESTGTSEPAG